MEINNQPGFLPYSEGTVSFGAGKPILCINDQCGYLIERIKVQEELLREDFSSLIRLARDGMKKGLDFLNVQLMTPALIKEEKRLFPKVVQAIYEETGCGIAVDTKDPDVLERVLALYPHKAICNCINGKQETLETMLPIISAYKGVVGTALVDELGIPDTLERRLAVARRILIAAENAGIPREDVMMDAVCLPAGVAPDSMPLTLKTIEAFKDQLGVPTLLGSSNAGFMMPNHFMIDSVYFVASVSHGLNVAMISLYMPDIEWLMATLDFLLGVDPYASRFLALHRDRK